MSLAYIGLGSNLGDRLSNIEKAKDELVFISGIEIVQESAIEETEPVDFLNQPNFLNQVILIKTDISPIELLRILQDIEIKIGRKKIFSKGPRIIDMDILLYNNITMNTEQLRIPHPEINNRMFVLKHLLEIDRNLEEPGTGIQYWKIYNKN